MKIGRLIICLAATVNIANAGPIKDMATNDPEGTLAFIQSADYPTLLQFVQDAYAEYLAENQDPVLQYTYIIALNEAGLDKQVRLAVDFSLAQSDILIKQIGARAIFLSLTKGSTPDGPLRQQAVTALKSNIQGLSQPSREAYDFARYAAYALMLMNDDAGLDMFLTDTETVGNYQAKDGWQPESDANTFQALAGNYTQAAAEPGNENPEWDHIMAGVYELARLRRVESKEVKHLNPLKNLGALKKP